MIRRLLYLLVFVLLGCSVAGAGEITVGPPHPASLVDPDRTTGYIPPNFDDTWVPERWDLDLRATRDTMDWRPYAPIARNQNPCGTCWIFCSLGDMEIQMNIDGLGSWDFSEDHLKECNVFNTQCAGGGNFWMSGNYLQKSGARLESCQPYHPYDYHCVTACEPVYRLREFRTVANTVAAIKDALNHGPVITSMNAAMLGSAFDSYNGSYVISGGTATSTDHCVMIVGYDDPAFSPTENFWIVRNSWGTGWGDNGYFYINYDVAGIGLSACQFTNFELPLADQELDLMVFDTEGCNSYLGTGSDNDMWGAVRFVPTYNGTLERVEFVELGANFNYTINIYNTRMGSDPNYYFTDLLYSNSAAGVPRGGYFSVDISPPMPISTGNDFYVAVQFQTPGGIGYPIPVDLIAPVEGESYLSTTGTGASWQTYSTDVCIRAITNYPDSSLPATGPIGLGLLLTCISGLLIWKRKK